MRITKTHIIIFILIIGLLVWVSISDKKAIEKCKTTGRTEFECKYELNR